MFNFEMFTTNNDSKTRANLIDQDGIVTGCSSFTHEVNLDDEPAIRFAVTLYHQANLMDVTASSHTVWSGCDKPWVKDRNPGAIAGERPIYLTTRVQVLDLEDNPLFLGVPAIDFEAAALKLYSLGLKASTSSQEVA